MTGSTEGLACAARFGGCRFPRGPHRGECDSGGASGSLHRNCGKEDRTGQPCFIIAEAGVNHNGSLEHALKLVDAAAAAGADAVEPSSRPSRRTVLSQRMRRRPSISCATGDAGTQHEMLKRLELAEEDHRALIDHCEKRGVLFLSHPSMKGAATSSTSLGLPAFKLPFGELTNLPFLAHVAGKASGLILFDRHGDAPGNRWWPSRDPATSGSSSCSASGVRPTRANLRALASMRSLFGFPVGFSDHTPGIVAAITAVVLGACVVEKHFTLIKNARSIALSGARGVDGDGTADPNCRNDAREKRPSWRGGNCPGGAQESRCGLRYFRRYGSGPSTLRPSGLAPASSPACGGACSGGDEGRRTARCSIGRCSLENPRCSRTTSRADFGIYSSTAASYSGRARPCAPAPRGRNAPLPTLRDDGQRHRDDGFNFAERVKMLSNSDDPAAIVKSMARGRRFCGSLLAFPPGHLGGPRGPLRDGTLPRSPRSLSRSGRSHPTAFGES